MPPLVPLDRRCGRSPSRRGVVPALLLLALLTGCGSTVQVRGTVAGQVPGSGLQPGVGSAPTGSGGTPAGSGMTGGSIGAGSPVVGGSTSGGRASGTGGGGSSAGATVVAPASPASAVRSPLKLGLLDVASANAALAAVGSGAQTNTSGQQLARAFVSYYNKHGGLAGRKIQLVEYSISPTANNYATEGSAACAKFTQDNHLSLVMSQTGNVFLDNYESCLSKAGVTDFLLSTAAVDDTTLSQYPRMYEVASPTMNRRYTALLQGLSSAGVLTSKSTVGVVVEDCAAGTRAYAKSFAPEASRLKLKVMRRDVSCLQGFGQAASWLAEVSNTVLPFRSAGVDRIVFVSAWESLALQGFENQANNQGYRPDYALTSAAQLAVAQGQYSAAQNARFHGVGWVPIFDVTGGQTNSATRQCLTIARGEGVTVASQTDVSLVNQVCEHFMIVQRALTLSRGHDDAASIQAAMRTLRQGYVSPLQLDGVQRISADQRDGGQLFATVTYTAACGCFRYGSQHRALA